MSHQEGNCNGDLGRTARNRISEITGIQVQNLMRKLNAILPIMLPQPLELQEMLHEGDFTTGEYNPKTESTGKHVLQEVSILGHLRRIHALQEQQRLQQGGELGPNHTSSNTVALELGAGTGKLSDRLQKVTNARMHHVLIDRQNFQPQKCRIRHMIARRNKIHSIPLEKVGEKPPNDSIEPQLEGRRKRPRLSSSDPSFPVVKRVVNDIASLKLEECINCFELSTSDEAVKDSEGDIDDQGDGSGSSRTGEKQPMFPTQAHQEQSSICICLSKHLCGPACDLSINAINRVDDQLAVRPDYIVVATCCHYLCTWDSFTPGGREFWLSLGLNQDDFEVAITVSQWASLKKNKAMSPPSFLSPTSSLATSSGKDARSTSPFPNLLDLAQMAGESLRSSAYSSPSSPSSLVPSEEFERSFSHESKIALGIQAKQLLDLARIAALQREGIYDVELVRYTTRSVEDRLLVGYKRRSGI